MFRVPYLLLSLMIIMPFISKGQVIETSKVDSTEFTIGGELKGMNIMGATAILAGVGVAVLPTGFDGGHGAVFSPIVAGGLTVAPASLVGLGLGSLFAKNHSKFNRPFQVGMGVTFSPIFIDTSKQTTGINFRILSPEIGNWRYNLGFDYFSGDYQLSDGTTRGSWYAVNLDLQYLIHTCSSMTIYPFVGTQINNSTKYEIYTNFGLGFNYQIHNNWNFFSEYKMAFDPDKDFRKGVFTLGVSRYLNF